MTTTNLVPFVDPLAAARDRVRAVELAATRTFFERERHAHAILLTLIASGNTHLVGPPGTAKSAMIDFILDRFAVEAFKTLCHKQQPLAEFFGPVDPQSVIQGNGLERVSLGMLQEAIAAFFDEVYRAGGAVLNPLLQMLNERRYAHGGRWVKTPLRFVAMASNDMPEDERGELAAFEDRRMTILYVDSVKDDTNFAMMLAGARERERVALGVATGPADALPSATLADLDTIARAAALVPVGPTVDAALRAIMRELGERGIYVSDRKAVMVDRLIRTEAAYAGASAATTTHLACLTDALWSRPEQRPIVDEVVLSKVATWLKATRSAHAAIDKEGQTIAAVKVKSLHDAMTVLAPIGKRLAEIKASIAEIEQEHGADAHAECEILRQRVTGAEGKIGSLLTTLGLRGVTP